MNRSAARVALRDGLPSHRALAAEWFESNGNISDRELLERALFTETVAQIRLAITKALRVIEPLVPSKLPPTDDNAAILSQIPSLIRHELEPAIGILRLAANRDVPELESSRTGAAIRNLRRQVDAVERLAAANRSAVRKEVIPVGDLVSDAATSLDSPPHIELDSDSEQQTIYTDWSLMNTIVRNALANAVEAGAGTQNSPIGITLDRRSGLFLLTIVNSSVGPVPSPADLERVGFSSKGRGRGLGLIVMRRCAVAIGATIALRISAGSAVLEIEESPDYDH